MFHNKPPKRWSWLGWASLCLIPGERIKCIQMQPWITFFHSLPLLLFLLIFLPHNDQVLPINNNIPNTDTALYTGAELTERLV